MTIHRPLRMATAGLGMLAYGFAGGGRAEDIGPGTIITKDNITRLSDHTFEGTRLGDLLVDRVVWQVREQGLTVPLKATTPWKPNPKWEAATKKYADTVVLDTSSKNISGYLAGLPFPKINIDDPDAGLKIIWNHTYGGDRADAQYSAASAFILIDGKSGVDREITVSYQRAYMLGLVSAPEPVIGDGSIAYKTLIYFLQPYDVKGLGTFSIKYTDGRLDDIWAYVRAVRRVRRLSGGAWFDTIGGSDQLQDDVNIFNAHPTWYNSYKLLGKRKALVIAKSMFPTIDLRKTEAAERYPIIKSSEAPYWQPNDQWEVRELYAVETIPPDIHPYSKKIFYVEIERYAPIFGEAFDRKGEFWRWLHFIHREWQNASDPSISHPYLSAAAIIDYQRRHATFALVGSDFQLDPPGFSPDDISLSRLEAAGR